MTEPLLAHPPLGLRFRSVSRSHPGARRGLNEDRVLDSADSGLWAVADGMGGHREGGVAATRLVEALQSLAPAATGYARLAEALRRIDQINADLFSRQDRDGQSGSTLVFLLVHEAHYACVWAGDSRAYRLRDGRLSAITRDHSVVQDLVETGMLRDSQRRSHPNSHIVTRAIGAAASVELDQRFAPIEVGDVFLLCSDGLTACLSDDRIAAMLGPDLPRSADCLLSAALEGGAPDNVSIVLIRADDRDPCMEHEVGGSSEQSTVRQRPR